MKKGRGQTTGCSQWHVFPSVLRHCWVGDIQPTKQRATYLQSLPEQVEEKTKGDRLTQIYLEKRPLKWKYAGK